jgi:hypothetical protein
MSSEADVFEMHRADLLALAYRMLGDMGRAEDMVQEAWVRWQNRQTEVTAPKAFLVTTVTHLCLDDLTSARARREEPRITTCLFGVVMTLSGGLYLMGPRHVVEGFRHLGYPDYFRTLLGIAKLLGVAAILGAGSRRTLREWAYAGFTFDLIAAALSHAIRRDGRASVFPLILLGLLAASYLLWHRPRGPSKHPLIEPEGTAGLLSAVQPSGGRR